MFNKKTMKTHSIEINLSEYDKELLIALVCYAHERDLTFNEAIVEILIRSIDHFSQKTD